MRGRGMTTVGTCAIAASVLLQSGIAFAAVSYVKTPSPGSYENLVEVAIFDDFEVGKKSLTLQIKASSCQITAQYNRILEDSGKSWILSFIKAPGKRKDGSPSKDSASCALEFGSTKPGDIVLFESTLGETLTVAIHASDGQSSRPGKLLQRFDLVKKT